MGRLYQSMAAQVPDYYKQKRKVEAELGVSLSNKEFEDMYLEVSGDAMTETETSVFDPCLCEMNYTWFTTDGDRILDPFAGGSVRGIVAAVMGREYTGIELRGEQVAENDRQASEICKGTKPLWIVGDSMNMDELIGCSEFDHLFTCPPYGDLEVYSDDARDISNMGFEEFKSAYCSIIEKAVSHLREDRFATFVVGNYRDKSGNLIDLCGMTIDAMESAGCHYYNDMVLVTPAASLPVRAGKAFQASRKIGRRHQYVLNFVKGDGKRAASRLGDVVLAEFDSEEGE